MTTLSDKLKPKTAQGKGRRRLENNDMLERIVREELESIYKAMRGNKRQGIPGRPLTAEEAKKIEALSRAQQNLDERKVRLQTAVLEAEAEVDDLTPEQLRQAMQDLKQKQRELEAEQS